MKYAIIALTVVVIMQDISIRRLNRKFEVLHSFFDVTIRQLEKYALEQTEVVEEKVVANERAR